MYYQIDDDYKAFDLSLVPRDATMIRCNKRSLNSLKGCPRKTEDLDVASTSISSLDGISSNVKKLNCDYCRELTNISKLPEKLIYLRLSSCPIDSLPKMPNISILDVGGTKIRRLPNLDINQKMESLDLGYLKIDNSDLATFPRVVEHLNIQSCPNLTSFKGCPQAKSIHCLGNSNITSFDGFPSTVVDISLGEMPNINLLDLPTHVKKLKLYRHTATSMLDIPTHIEELELSDTRLVNFHNASKNLKKLEYSGFIKNAYGLPQTLNKLHVTYGTIQTLMGLPSVSELFVYETNIRSNVVNCLTFGKIHGFFDRYEIKHGKIYKVKSESIFRAKLELAQQGKKLPLI